MQVRSRTFAAFAFSALLAGSVAACGGSKGHAKGAEAPAATCYDGGLVAEEPADAAALPPYEGPMPIVEPSHMAEELAAAGLDIKHLPPIDSLDRKQIGRVMKTFSKSLGIACIGCHDLDDFAKMSPRKRVAKRMWNDFVRNLAMEDGQPVYCDSCHQGSVQGLDRRDKKLLASYMDDVFVGKLKRADGKDHDCGTCHGDPPEFKLLKGWRAE
jgi:hypothetical protein